MTKPNIFTELRNARVERILSTKQSRILTAPWTRRTLSIVAIVSSYVVMATLLIPTPYTISKTNRVYPDYDLMEKVWFYGFRDITQGIAIFLAIWSFIVLRMSMRRVTLLPDEYLDELQITNRNWAYRSGYLVVRRIGLAVTALFAFLATVGNQLTGFLAGYGATPKFFRSLERYFSDLSMEDPFGFYFKSFLLLTFVAYSFPVILLAWREARFPELVPQPQSTKELTEKEKTAKFYFAALKLILISIAIFGSFVLSPKLFVVAGGLYFALIIPLLYLVIPGALLLFIWVSITVARDLIELRKTGYKSQEQKRWASIATAFLTVTLILGMAVGSSILGLFSGFASGIGYSSLVVPFAFIVGLLMIPTQAASVTFYAKLDGKSGL